MGLKKSFLFRKILGKKKYYGSTNRVSNSLFWPRNRSGKISLLICSALNQLKTCKFTQTKVKYKVI